MHIVTTFPKGGTYMKKLLIIFSILLTLSLVNAYPNYAKADNDDQTQEEIEDSATSVPGKKGKVAEKRKEVRNQIKEKGLEFRTNAAQAHAKRLERRFGFYYRRLTKIADKVQSRIAKTEAKHEGLDLSAATARLEIARTTLEDARAEGEAAVVAFNEVEPTTPKELQQAAKKALNAAKTTREAFMEAASLLKQSVKLIKQNLPKEE